MKTPKIKGKTRIVITIGNMVVFDAKIKTIHLMDLMRGKPGITSEKISIQL